MKKIIKNILVGLLSLSLVVGLMYGFTIVKADGDGTPVELNYWLFSRGGVKNECNNGNEGRINSVTMNDTSEVITGWITKSAETQEQTATQKSTGFSIDIARNGWDKAWKKTPMNINPYQIQAKMPDVSIIPGHIYTVSFKAHATPTSSHVRKYAYVSFRTVNRNGRARTVIL